MTYLRVAVAAMVLAGGIFATHSFKPKVAAAPHWPLREFPSDVGLSHSEDRPFESQVVRAVGADDYINRVYIGGALPIELYVGYYKDQRSGDRIHSPKNCLPGSGWEPVHASRVEIGSEGGVPVLVNGYLVAQGLRRNMVLYWYQSRGQIVASEYMAKFLLIADGLKNRPTDGAMVRIWTTAADGEVSAQARAAEFARRVYPQIEKFLPD
ncbi:MAG TPA: EpsI family protein [Candidatus Acidoferrum sp.]|nr:EpsI family protein [Candidatus Acidoferrum sp.]